MTALSSGNADPGAEANEILSRLLARLDEVLGTTSVDSAGLPLFAVGRKDRRQAAYCPPRRPLRT